MTDTTQPHPEPSQEASSLPVVAYQHRKRGKSWGPAVVADFIMEGFERRELTPRADAQSQLNAMRVERDAVRAEAKEIRARWNDAENEFSALKAKQVADVEAAMRLAEAYRTANYSERDAAREALRAHLTKDRT